ncbi:pisatin demethylase [Verticillium alfalfae VaMs.102]|uniref:Pisatin demethylase n=1 Tax=Verticillium alfalfae (strain VaMs.102 / ATCC MYA-4576 / FGSC 10136) TaxID=526221 RepID=C9SW95_VERA1|nr:pisatin demethylase [Verticillium alfalfae VaMs.102]EEY23060.1 pisatin demethylase [Verticillium alfalfae VaMs.102]
MLIEQVLPKTAIGYLALVLSLLAAKLLVNRFGGGLNGIPGPFAASFTDWWRLFIVWGRRPELSHIKLHEKYGPLVRLGPRTVSVGNAEAIKTIYALNAGFVKSGFYPVQQTIANGHCLQSMFNTTDEKFHARLRRSVSSAYSMSTLVNFEPLVDSTSEEFLKQLKQRYTRNEKANGELDFGQWLQFYAFDVIGELTYSKRLGFVDRGEDVDDIIQNLEGLLNYVAVIGQLPILDKLLLKNPFRMWLSKHNLLNFNSPVVEFAKRRMAERSDIEKEAQEELPTGKTARKDFLSRFKDARKKDPEFISEERVLALTVANMFAGSDTTAISLRAVFYLLLKHPEKMEKLLHELSTESQAGRFARPDALVQWEEVRSLPYLSAVINEALRCHPAAGLTLERVVPSQGINVAGQRIPGGTIVGCSAWVVHRDESVFGSRTDEFRPERWIDANPAELSLMKSCLFSFGAGSRTCIGKNISLLEIFKLVPAILRTFELELVDPDSPWVLHNAWFVKQSNLFVRLKERESIL